MKSILYSLAACLMAAFCLSSCNPEDFPDMPEKGSAAVTYQASQQISVAPVEYDNYGLGVNIVSHMFFPEVSNGVIMFSPKPVSIADRAFEKNPDLQSISIPASVKSLGYAVFDYDTNLQSVTFEKGSKLEYLDAYVFSHAGLTEITFPSGLKQTSYSIFNDCDQLQTVTFTSLIPPAMREDPFDGCDQQNITIKVPAMAVSSYEKAFATFLQQYDFLTIEGY